MLHKVSKNDVPQAVLTVCRSIQALGGQAWLVGGCVRDLLLGLAPKDWDMEVYGLELVYLNQHLQTLGKCEQVGRHFGVSKLWIQGLEIDVAVPRTEKKSGLGHKGFEVSTDPYISPEKACLRRDFTMNAMMFDPLQGELHDFHHGLDDLEAKVLRAVSPAFAEDPLRPLRAMQFAARFQLNMDKDTAAMCQALMVEADSLPAARIWQEWLKWSKSDYPSWGLIALKDMGWLALYPELFALQGCAQHTRWHPEGDVWRHTCLVVDEAAKLAAARGLRGDDRVVLLFAALCHDLGKPLTSIVDEDGQIQAPNHGECGTAPSKSFLKAIAAPKWLCKQVLPLVEMHVAHFAESVSTSAVLWLAYRLHPVNIVLWEMLTEADASGCSPLPATRPALAWLEEAKVLNVQYQQQAAIITGKVLINMGAQPSRQFGALLNKAYKAQLDGAFSNVREAKLWLRDVADLDK